MSAVELFQQRHVALPFVNRDEVIARYQRLRTAGRNLNSKLVKRLSHDVLREGGNKLGILQGGTFVFETEDESSVLSDYCIYDVRRNGRNAIEQYLIDCPPDPQSDEMICLRSMQRATYSLFVVESVEHGFGLMVRDLISPGVLFVVDIGFGSSARPGLVLASRMLPDDEFSRTSGAALPVAVLTADQREAWAKKFLTARAPEDAGYFDPAPLIRACLSNGSSSHVQYVDLPGQATRQQRIPSSVPATPGRTFGASDRLRRPSPQTPGRTFGASVGRNSPCPCGSGKKFKRCCLDGSP